MSSPIISTQNISNHYRVPTREEGLKAAALTALFVLLARLVWRLGVRSYSGASA